MAKAQGPATLSENAVKRIALELGLPLTGSIPRSYDWLLDAAVAAYWSNRPRPSKPAELVEL